MAQDTHWLIQLSFSAYVYVVCDTRASIIDSVHDLIFRNTIVPLVHTKYCTPVVCTTSQRKRKERHFCLSTNPIETAQPQATTNSSLLRSRYGLVPLWNKRLHKPAPETSVLPLQIPPSKFQPARTDGPGCN